MTTTTKEDTITAVRERVKRLADDMPAHNFKTGSRGYYIQSREVIDGTKYMVNIQVIEVGTKPAEQE